MLPVKRILVPVDFSECSVAALRTAIELAEHFDASIDVVYVWEQPYYVNPELMLYVPGGDGQSLIDYARAQAEEELEGVLTRVPDSKVPIHRRLANGRPHKKIIEIVEAEKFDLVVMGTHGRTGLTHLILGSVAEKVIRRSPAPVLTVGWKPAETEAAEGE